MGVVDALAREVGSVGRALHKLTKDEWARPTRCEPMNVLELVAHMARGAVRIQEMLANDPVDEQPEKDSVTHWMADLEAEAPMILRRAQEAAKEFAPGGPADMVRFWDTNWVRALQLARASDDGVRPAPFGLMRPSDYYATRILEVTVHHMDLDDAVGHAYHPDPEALSIVADTLRSLLGTDMRPVKMDEIRFVLVGTGRAQLTDDERAYLGPLASKFPLIR